jgi:hypothetical protein
MLVREFLGLGQLQGFFFISLMASGLGLSSPFLFISEILRPASRRGIAARGTWLGGGMDLFPVSRGWLWTRMLKDPADDRDFLGLKYLMGMELGGSRPLFSG